MPAPRPFEVQLKPVPAPADADAAAGRRGGKCSRLLVAVDGNEGEAVEARGWGEEMGVSMLDAAMANRVRARMSVECSNGAGRYIYQVVTVMRGLNVDDLGLGTTRTCSIHES